MHPIPRIQVNDTRQFTVTYSVAPLGTPHFTMYAGSGDGILVHSAIAVASSTTAFFAMFTFPDSRMLYTWAFTGSYQDGFVTDRGYVQAIKLTPG